MQTSSSAPPVVDAIEWASNFGVLDGVIVVAYLLGTLAIGIYVNRVVHGMADFLVAGRALKSALAIATMVGSELGLVTVMYASQTGFTGGFAAFHIGLIAGIVTLIVGLTGFIVVRLREMKVMTIPEFYERRFGRKVRIVGGAILAFAGILNMGLFLKAGTIFLTGLTGIQDPASDTVKWIMTGLIVMVLVYTTLGGMVSVVLTDYAQFVVLSFGMLIAVWLSVQAVGWDKVVTSVQEVHGTAGFDPTDWGGTFGPSYVIWMIFTAGLVSCAVWQTAVMRACAAESTQVVKRLYIWSSLGFMIRFLLPQFLGICALAWFWNDEAGRAFFFTAEGETSADPVRTMQAMPIFLAQVLPTGIIGLIGAGMLAAFMSTHDSYLLCWSSVLVQDVIAPLKGGDISDRGRMLLTRLFIVLIGGFLLIWSLWYPLGDNLWDYMAISGAIYFTGAFALLLFGLYWKRASRFGAYLALAAGTLSVCGLEPVRKMLGLVELQSTRGIEIRADHIGLASAGLALVGMVVGSLLWPDREGSTS